MYGGNVFKLIGVGADTYLYFGIFFRNLYGMHTTIVATQLRALANFLIMGIPVFYAPISQPNTSSTLFNLGTSLISQPNSSSTPFVKERDPLTSTWMTTECSQTRITVH